MEFKARNIVRRLLQAGFEEVRVTGDHHRYDDHCGHKVTVIYAQLGDSIKQGTYYAILKQAGFK